MRGWPRSPTQARRRRSSRRRGRTGRRTLSISRRGSQSRASGSRRLIVLAREDFQYAVVRVVPRVERGECLNAGVVLFCRRLGFLAARTEIDEAALAVLAPDCDPAEVRPHLQAIERVAAG